MMKIYYIIMPELSEGIHQMEQSNSLNQELSSRKFQWHYPVILSLATVAAYANHFDGTFLMDDLSNIVENSTLRLTGGLGENWKDLFAHGRPLAFISFLIDFKLWGLNTVGFHIFNLFIHLLAGLAAYGFVSTTLTNSPKIPDSIRRNGPMIGFITALLWALHPLNTQAVTYIVQRAESMMGLFFLVSVFAATKAFSLQDDPGSRREFKKWQWASIIGAVLSVSAKQIGVAAPVVILACQWLFWSGAESGPFKENFLKQKRLYIGLLFSYVAAGLLLALPTLDPHSGFQFKGVLPFDYLKSQPGVIFHYLGLAFWPKNLVLDYGWQVAEGVAAVAIPGLMLLAILGLTVFGMVKRNPWSILGVWFFAILAPSSSILPIKDLAFEHRMYLPLLALLTGFTCCLWIVFNRLNMRSWVFGTVAIIAVAFGVRTHVRNYDYRSPITMWSTVLEQRPSNPRAFNELGNALIQVGRQGEAFQLFQQALALEPNNPGPLLNMSNILQGAGQLDQAQEALTKALELKPDFASAHFNMGNVYLAKNDLVNAEKSYVETIRLDPKYAEAHVGLGNTLAVANNFDRAMEEYQKALAIRPWLAQPYNNIGTIYSKLGKNEDAIKTYVAALNLNPNDVGIRLNLANTLLDVGNIENARDQYSVALRIQPGVQGAINGLNRIAEIAKKTPSQTAPQQQPGPMAPISPEGK